MKKLSKGLYVTVLASAPVVIFAMSFLRGLLGATADPIFLGTTSVALFLLFTGMAVFTLLLIYKMWASVQDGHARMTPGKAVLFLFIPFFGIYWMFQVFWGFAKDYNARLERAGLHSPRLRTGLFLACILLYFALGLSGGVLAGLTIAAAGAQSGLAIALLRVMSFVYLAMAATSYAVWVTVVVKICDAVNAVAQGHRSVEVVNVPDGSPALALHCATGEFVGRNVPLPQEGIVIGRSPAKAHLVLSSSNVSAAHVHVWPDPSQSGVWVRDMQSTNGTYYQNGHGSRYPEWLPIHEPKFLARHAHFRIGEDGSAEFEIR